MPSMFRRKPTETVTEPVAEEPAADPVAAEPADAEPSGRLPRGYTPSKKDRGLSTPKRPPAQARRPGTAQQPRSRKDMTKEERRELKEAKRARRRQITEGMRQGDPRYLAARDQGPERALARDVVDSRRTAGTWFFGGALIVLVGSSSAVPEVVLVANMLFVLMAMVLTVDSVALCRKVKRLVRERHPDSTQKMGGLYLYVVMRGITFRKLRIPLPRKNFGDPV